MAQTASFAFLFLGILTLSAPVFCISVPDPNWVPEVSDPTCVGGWDSHGTHYPKEQGGCCKGTECCQYEAFKDNPACVETNCTYDPLDCYSPCYPELTETCISSCLAEDKKLRDKWLDCISGNTSSPEAPAQTCSGLECCQYEEYENSPMCSCSGLDCCQYEEYENTPLCIVTPMPDCTGLGCCQYEEYKNTALCVVPPTPSEEECTAPPPDCPVGGPTAAPELLDPDIASRSKCRGACGPDCPNTCTHVEDVTRCIPDSKGECFYVCTYSNVLRCESHEGCRTHDNCYDICAQNGEKYHGLCHLGCDWGCITGFGLFGPIYCPQWMEGYGPVDKQIRYSSPPLRSKPLKSCP